MSHAHLSAMRMRSTFERGAHGFVQVAHSSVLRCVDARFMPDMTSKPSCVSYAWRHAHCANKCAEVCGRALHARCDLQAAPCELRIAYAHCASKCAEVCGRALHARHCGQTVQTHPGVTPLSATPTTTDECLSCRASGCPCCKSLFSTIQCTPCHSARIHGPIPHYPPSVPAQVESAGIGC
eukprot:1158858-Pelagomonas_calceolata.AAC.14